MAAISAKSFEDFLFRPLSQDGFVIKLNDDDSINIQLSNPDENHKSDKLQEIKNNQRTLHFSLGKYVNFDSGCQISFGHFNEKENSPEQVDESTCSGEDSLVKYSNSEPECPFSFGYFNEKENSSEHVDESSCSEEENSTLVTCTYCGSSDNISSSQRKKVKMNKTCLCLLCLAKRLDGRNMKDIQNVTNVPIGNRVGQHCCYGGNIENCLKKRKKKICTFKHSINLVKMVDTDIIIKKLPLPETRLRCSGCIYHGDPKKRPGCHCLKKNYPEYFVEGWIEFY